jgi:hypothetical protein
MSRNSEYETEEKKRARLKIYIANKEYDPDCFIDLKHLVIAIVVAIAIGSLLALLTSANYFLETQTF